MTILAGGQFPLLPVTIFKSLMKVTFPDSDTRIKRTWFQRNTTASPRAQLKSQTTTDSPLLNMHQIHHIMEDSFFFKKNYTCPVQPIISGPSKEKGSESSGSDRILYVFVSTSFVKYSLGSKWNSNVKV